MAVLALGFRPSLEFTELVELGMRGVHVVGLVEGLQCDLPVAVEGEPPAPFVAHVLQAERVENFGGGEQEVGQRLAVGIHVDPQPAAPGVDPDGSKVGVVGCESVLPVLLFADMRARAVEAIGPAVKAADKRLSGSGAGVLGALGRVDQAPAAVHADVVVCVEFPLAGAHHDDRVVENVVGQVTAHIGQLLHATDLLPNLAPQPVALGAGIVLRNVCLDPDRHRLREFLGRFGIHAFGQVGHHILLIAARKDSSLRKSEVLSASRWLHLRSSPPSTSSV